MLCDFKKIHSADMGAVVDEKAYLRKAVHKGCGSRDEQEASQKSEGQKDRMCK